MCVPYTGAVAFAAISFAVYDAVNRQRRAGIGEGEGRGQAVQAAAFLRINLLMTLAMVVHSMLATNPRTFYPTSSSALAYSGLSALALDVRVTVNAMHAVFVVGVASLFYHTRRSHYWWMLIVGHSFVAAAAVATLLDLLHAPMPLNSALPAWAVALAHAALSSSCLFQAYRIRAIVAKPPDESGRDAAVAAAIRASPPALLAQAGSARRAVFAQAAWFVLEVLATPLARMAFAPTASHMAQWAASPWAFEYFVSALIESYTGAIHKAIVLSQGLHAVTALRPALLAVFAFANSLFTAYYAVQTVSTLLWIGSGQTGCTMVAVANALALLIRLGLNTYATWSVISLRSHLLALFEAQSVPHTAVGPGTDVVRGRSLLAMAQDLFAAGYTQSALRVSSSAAATSALFALWVGECVWMAWLGSAHGEGIKAVGLGLNFGIHAVALYHLQFFKLAESRRVFPNRIRLHYCLAALLAVVAGSQAISALISVSHSPPGFSPHRVLLGIVLLRSVLAMWVAAAFFWLSLSPKAVTPASAQLVSLLDNRSSSAEEEEEEGSGGRDEDEEVYLAVRGPSEGVLVESGSPLGVALPVPISDVQSFTSSGVKDKVTRRLQTGGMGMLYVLLGAFSVIAWANGWVERVCMMGAAEAHAVGYGVTFHFSFLVTGFAYRGVHYLNTTNLVVMGLNSGVFALVAAGGALGTLSFDGWTAFCVFCVVLGGVASSFGWGFRHRVLARQLPDTSPIW